MDEALVTFQSLGCPVRHINLSESPDLKFASICTNKNLIFGITDEYPGTYGVKITKLSVWNADGRHLYSVILSKKMASTTESVVVLNKKKLVVVGSKQLYTQNFIFHTNTKYKRFIQYWKIKQKTTTVKLKPIKKLTLEGQVEKPFAWNGLLCAKVALPFFSTDSSFGLQMWTRKRKQFTPELEVEFINYVQVYHDLLWLHNQPRNQLQAYTIDVTNYTITMVTKIDIEGIRNFWFWNEKWIVTNGFYHSLAPSSFKVQVFDLEGQKMMSIDVGNAEPSEMKECCARLVCLTGRKNVKLINTDGNIQHNISLGNQISAFETTESNIVFGVDGKGLYVILAKWEIHRLLWIAWKKNKPQHCILARLPRELIRVIISFIQ